MSFISGNIARIASDAACGTANRTSLCFRCRRSTPSTSRSPFSSSAVLDEQRTARREFGLRTRSVDNRNSKPEAQAGPSRRQGASHGALEVADRAGGRTTRSAKGKQSEHGPGGQLAGPARPQDGPPSGITYMRGRIKALEEYAKVEPPSPPAEPKDVPWWKKEGAQSDRTAGARGSRSGLEAKRPSANARQEKNVHSTEKKRKRFTRVSEALEALRTSAVSEEGQAQIINEGRGTTPFDYRANKRSWVKAPEDGGTRSPGWNPTKKLSLQAMANMRALHRADPAIFTREVLSSKFKVSYDAVRRILRSKFSETHEMSENDVATARISRRVQPQQSQKVGLAASSKTMSALSEGGRTRSGYVQAEERGAVPGEGFERSGRPGSNSITNPDKPRTERKPRWKARDRPAPQESPTDEGSAAATKTSNEIAYNVHDGAQMSRLAAGDQANGSQGGISLRDMLMREAAQLRRKQDHLRPNEATA